MCVALVGGMDRLGKHYREEAKKFGVDLKVFSRAEADMKAKMKNVDAMIIFTNKISHCARKEAMNAAKSGGIQVMMCHSCGICTLRDCLNCVQKTKDSKEKR